MTARFLSPKPHSNQFTREGGSNPALLWIPIGRRSSRPAKERFDWTTVDVGRPANENVSVWKV